MSKKDAWFETTICGPSAARCSVPDSVTGMPAAERIQRAKRRCARSYTPPGTYFTRKMPAMMQIMPFQTVEKTSVMQYRKVRMSGKMVERGRQLNRLAVQRRAQARLALDRADDRDGHRR